MRHGISLLLICLLVFLVCLGKVIPDIEIKPTQKGIALGKDEVLEYAIEHIRKTKAF